MLPSRSINKLNLLFHKLNVKINPKALQSLKSLLRGYQININEEDDFIDASSLFHHLRERGDIDENNVDLLITLFTTIERKDLTDIVKDYQKGQNGLQNLPLEPDQPERKRQRADSGSYISSNLTTPDQTCKANPVAGLQHGIPLAVKLWRRASKDEQMEHWKEMSEEECLELWRGLSEEERGNLWESMDFQQQCYLYITLSSEERDALMKSLPECETWAEADLHLLSDLQKILKSQYKTRQRSNLDYDDLWSNNGMNRKKWLPKNLARRTLVEQELRNNSALATNMSIDWAEGEEFKQYDLLFALNLRIVSGGAKLADVIIDQLLPNADKRHLERALAAREDKIMIILDITDDSQEVVRKGEIAELIKGKYLPNATVIVNSMTTGGCGLIGEFADQCYIHRPKSGAA